MFGTIRKHSTWLWGFIIAAVAVGMVAYYGPANQSIGDAMGGGNPFGSVGSEEITQEDYLHAQAEARLQFLMMRGEWPGPGAQREGYDEELETYKRLFIIAKQKELGIEVGSDLIAKQAADNLRGLSRNGATVTMTQFDENVLKPGGVSLGDYQRFLRHQLGLQQLIAAVTVGSKLVTDKEAQNIYRRENQDRAGQALFFTASNYVSQVNPTLDALSGFYSNQMARYRLPDRIQVSYVMFKTTNYWAEAAAEIAKMTNLTAVLDGEYTRRGGTNYYPELTPEAAKASIREELHEQLALRAASQAANTFADPILSAKTIRAEMLAEAAAKAGVPLEISAPFDRNSAPADLDVNEQFIRAAFSLREEDPVAGPIATRAGIILFTKHKEIPSEMQPFSAVKDQVAGDFVQTESLKAARNAASEFVSKATNGLATGKTFAALCAEAKVKPVLLPPFSLSTRSLPEIERHMSIQQFKQIAFTIKLGDVSPAIPIMDGAVVTYINTELPLDEKKMAQELPEFVKLLRQARQQEAFDEWFSKEAPRALASTPVMRQRQQSNTPPGTGN